MSNSISPDGDVSRLHPVVRKKVKAILVDLRKKNIPFEVFEAMRTPQRQAHLYAKGRTTGGNKVTWVKPWGSIHQYGLAVDFVLKINGNWSWDDQGAEAAYWTEMHAIAKKHGMTPLFNSSGRLIEKPHVQLIGISSSDLRQGKYPAGGDAVWADYMAAMIDGWSGPQAAPPKPDLAPALPGIADDLMAELEAAENAVDPSPVSPVGTLSSAEADAKFGKLHSFIEWAEGGFSAHPDDNDGGATNFGITRKTLAAWRKTDVSVEDVRSMSKAEAQSILRANYFTRCRCGEMPEKMAMVVYNTAVLSGPDRAIRTLQAAFNETGLTISGKPLVVDGINGSNTMAAATQTDATVLSGKYLDIYEGYLRTRDNFDTFGNGWMNRIAKLREFLTTLPTGAGKRPKATMKIADNKLDVDVNDLLRIAMIGATGGKSAAVRAVLGKVMEQGATMPSQPALAGLLAQDGLDIGDIAGLAAPALAEKVKPNLTPVNAALGEGIGRALNGKKSVIGILGVLAAAIVPELGVLTESAQGLVDGENQTILMTLASLFTSWGFLGKIDKAIRSVGLPI